MCFLSSLSLDSLKFSAQRRVALQATLLMRFAMSYSSRVTTWPTRSSPALTTVPYTPA
jgi:hypothetical protein